MWDKKNFRARKDSIIKHFKKSGISNDSIVDYCTLAGIPITVTCEFLLEEFPEHSELLQQKIKDINKFYGIKPKTCGTCAVFCGNSHCVTKER